MYNFIQKSVGKYGQNRKEDVMTIQIRLNRWIMEGRMPGLDLLAVDGHCGPKTKVAIGAFQLQFVQVAKIDCRVDPGGKTLAMLFTSLLPEPKVPEPVYVDWLANKKYDDPEEEQLVSQKRGSFWWGVGYKASAGSIFGGRDVVYARLYNLRAPGTNRFHLCASTERTVNAAFGASGGPVLAFVTGIYYPRNLNQIQASGVDYSLAIGPKWVSLAKWAVKIPYLVELAGMVRVAQFATGKALADASTVIKGALSGFGLSEHESQPTFTAIDLPFGGGGTELGLYYGITSYEVLSAETD